MDTFRNLFKISFLENIIVKKTQNKPLNNFYVKLLPSNHQYAKNTKRKAFRNNVWFELDISDYMDYIVYFGIDAENRTPLTKIIMNNAIIFDIGTNIGETLLLFARTNTLGRNYGFEPVPYLYKRAEKNISLNDFSNIILNNIALSNVEEELYFELPNNFNSGGINMHKQAKKQDMQKVLATTIDTYVTQHQISTIDLIKIDVEGFEMNVLEGGYNSIKKYKPVLFIELSENNLQSKGSSSKELVQFLISVGYVKIINTYNNKIVSTEDDFTNCHFDIVCYA